jgi:hypothetical protein
MNNIEFYRDQYLHEIERSRFLDNIVPYPTTLIVIFIGGVVYSFSRYFSTGLHCNYSLMDIIYIVLLLLFSISTLITIFYLFTVFHGFTRKYSYLPNTTDLLDHESKILKYFYRYSEKMERPDRIKDAIQNTCENLEGSLKKYYIELADTNQRINDKRSENYFFTRTFLFIDLVLFIPITVIGLLK